MSDDRLMVLATAALELERLLGHLRSCFACWSGEGCLDCHFLVKDVQNKTEAARKLAHQLLPSGAGGQ